MVEAGGVRDLGFLGCRWGFHGRRVERDDQGGTIIIARSVVRVTGTGDKTGIKFVKITQK